MQTKKDRIKVVVYVDDWRVEGDLHVLSDSRLTDALNARMKDFLAITDATIYDARSGEKLVDTKFLDINRTSISIIHTID
ncbi:MAG: hypothetical protein Q7V62_08460 [Actinomycetota bacterium]|nr:hypothetical protein [Actinomycetota bacterium]